MPPHTTPPPAADDVAATAQTLLEQLQAELAERGLTVKVDGVSWTLTATNPQNTHLSQRVTLAPDDAGVLAWHWTWPGDGDEVEHERICAGAAIGEVTTRLSRVVSTHRIATTLSGGNSNRGASV